MTSRVGDTEKNMTSMGERMASSENSITIIEQKLAEFLDRISKLESGSGANLKIERWDEATQSLYLVPAN